MCIVVHQQYYANIYYGINIYYCILQYIISLHMLYASRINKSSVISQSSQLLASVIKGLLQQIKMFIIHKAWLIINKKSIVLPLAYS